MLVIFVMATAMVVLRRLLPGRRGLCGLINTLLTLIIAATVIGRLISGVHWFTDIAAGVLLSGALVMPYYPAVKTLGESGRGVKN